MGGLAVLLLLIESTGLQDGLSSLFVAAVPDTALSAAPTPAMQAVIQDLATSLNAVIFPEPSNSHLTQVATVTLPQYLDQRPGCLLAVVLQPQPTYPQVTHSVVQALRIQIAHTVLLWFCVMVMLRFLSRHGVSCLSPSLLLVALNLPCRLAAVANAL
jgi:hypothetical protein